MLDKNKKYWLYIEPYVYCNIKKDKVLLYNTENGSSMETAMPENIEILRSLHNEKNLGAVCLNETMLSNSIITEFISEFCNKNMGNIIDVEQEKLKPIQMMPVLNLQQDIERLSKYQHSTSTNSLKYLLELNIYINTECPQDCCLCDIYYKQCLCCHSYNDNDVHQELDIQSLNKLLYQIKYSSIGKINILGGDIFRYSHYTQLFESLSGFYDRIYVWNHYTNYIIIDKDFLVPGINHHVIITMPFEDAKFKHSVSILQEANKKYHFYFTTEAEYTHIEQITSEYNIEDFCLHPIFNGTNVDLFEQYVFSTKEDILSEKKTYREIFANQKLNTTFFGSLTILPSGGVYANLNKNCLGNITNMEIIKIIHKELIENTMWRKIRNSTPCCDCIYQYLCPSPSNYELIMNKTNLCHI